MRSRKHTKNLRKKRLRTKKKYNKTQKGGYGIELESTNPSGEYNFEWYELNDDGIKSFDETLYYKNIFVRPSINEDGTIVTIIYNNTYKNERVYKDIISGIYTFESPYGDNIKKFFVKLISKWMAHYITPKPRRRRRRLGDSSRAVPRRRKRRLTTSRFSSIPKKSTTLLSSSQSPSPSSILRPPIPTPRLRQPVPKPRLRPPTKKDNLIIGTIKTLVATLLNFKINLLIFDWDQTISKLHMYKHNIGKVGINPKTKKKYPSVEDINLEDYFHLFDNGRSVFVELVLRLSDAGIRVAIASFGRCSAMGDTLDRIFELHNLNRKEFIPNNLIFGGAYDPQHDLYCIEPGYGKIPGKGPNKNNQITEIIKILKDDLGKDINAFFIDDTLRNITNLVPDLGVNYTHNIKQTNGGFGIGYEQIEKMIVSLYNPKNNMFGGFKSRRRVKRKVNKKKRSKRK